MMLRDTIVYLGSAIAAKALPFIMLPIVTRLVSPDQVGAAFLLMLYWSFSNAVVSGNGYSYLSRRYYELNSDDVSRLASNVLAANALLCGLVTVLFVIASFIFPEALEPFGSYLLFLPFGSLLQAGVTIATTLARFEQRPYRFMVYEIGFAIASTVSAILYILYIDTDWGYQFWSIALSVIATFVLAFVLERRFQRPELSNQEVLSVLRFCMPQIVYIISGIALSIGDRYLIGQILSTQILGVYAATYMLCSAFNVLIDAYVRSYSPTQFKLINNEGIGTSSGRILLVRSAGVLLLMAVLLGIILWLAFSIIYPPEYMDGRQLVPMFIAGFLFFGIYKLLNPFILAMHLQNQLVVILVTTAAISLALDYILLEKWGILIAGLVTMGSYLVLAATTLAIYMQGLKRDSHN